MSAHGHTDARAAATSARYETDAAEGSGPTASCAQSVHSQPAARTAPPTGRFARKHSPEVVARLRKMVAGGMSVQAAGLALGLTREQAKHLGRFHGIKAARHVAEAARAATRAANAPAPAPQKAPPNPKLSAAQQAHVDKRKNWKPRDPRLAAMPKPSRDEAAALVADFLTRGGSVTQCPPAAPVVQPNNAGMRFK